MAIDQDQQTEASLVSDCSCYGKGGWGRRIGYGGVVTFEHYCYCPAGRSALSDHNAAKDATAVDNQKAAIATAWNQSGIPKRFQGFTLESSPNSISPASDSPESWFFWGEVGTGKTGLAVGYARKLLEAGMVAQVLFVSVPDLLSELRDTYNDENASELAIIKRYVEAELLILDDLGAEQGKGLEWIQDRLYQIVGKRHGEMRPTVFTSNYSLADLGTRLGARIAWRIRESVGQENILEIAGPNLRDR